MSQAMFAALGVLGSEITIHNVRLVDVVGQETGISALHVECDGRSYQVLGEESQARALLDDVGAYGYLASVRMPLGSEPPAPVRFVRYDDQSLRRAVELDQPDADATSCGRVPCTAGWRCDNRPHGFLAPVGLVPGRDGQFVKDESTSITIRIPSEFVEVCRENGYGPEYVLRAFMADAADITNPSANPRADSLARNGSDESDLAENYLARAYGDRRERAAAYEAMKEQMREAREEREEMLEEVDSLLDDYIESGGNADDFTAIVRRALAEKGHGN